MMQSHMAHHIKALPPALRAMQKLGYDATDCLAGTGLSLHDLGQGSAEAAFTLEQELHFHRNLLALTGDPLLGLKLGRAYSVETYGLMGYAFLSAPTLRHALTIAGNYGMLSFSLFKMEFMVQGRVGKLRFSRGEAIPDDLLQFYVDRDLTAGLYGGENALQKSLSASGVDLMHAHMSHRAAYEQHFACHINFGTPYSELRFDAAVLEEPMPMVDPTTSEICQQQCQRLLARLSHSSGVVEKVRQLIVARPGFFPDIDYVAERLNMTSRTLRRRLADESSGYQEILSEVRYQLAREYLSTSTLPLEEISTLLGYSAPGNFTNAFKRWHGTSPRQFRQESP